MKKKKGEEEKKSKKGISAVVAVVLIILIVVVGGGVLWKVVLPLFEELEFLSYSDVELNIVKSGYTIYDAEKHFAFVQIKRGSDSVNMTGIEIGFLFNKTSKTYQSSKVPQPGGTYTYKFDFTKDEDYGVPQDEAPRTVTVAPIFVLNNKIRLGKNLDEEDLPSGDLAISDEELEKEKAKPAETIVVVHVSGGDSPGVPVESDCVSEVCGNGEDDDCDGDVDSEDRDCSCPLITDCTGDFNDDRVVNQTDLDLFWGNWLRTDCAFINHCCDGMDLNDDGRVNFVDYAFFAQNWLKECD